MGKRYTYQANPPTEKVSGFAVEGYSASGSGSQISSRGICIALHKAKAVEIRQSPRASMSSMVRLGTPLWRDSSGTLRPFDLRISRSLSMAFFLRGVIEFPNAVCNLEQNNQTDYNRGSANKWIPIGALSDNEAGYQNPKGKIVIFQVESLLSVWYTELKQEPLLGEVGKPQPLMSLGFERFNQNGQCNYSFDYKLPDFLFGHLLAFLFAQFSHPLSMFLLYHVLT